MSTSHGWTVALELRSDRSVASGSTAALVDALSRGADLRMYTEFIFEEHVEPGWAGDPGLRGPIREVIDFRQTIVLDGRHAAGMTTLRQPLHPPFGFNGTDPRMAYFFYTSDADQARANLLIAGREAQAARAPGAPSPGTRTVNPPPADMPRMSPEEAFDLGTLGPSRNFVYEMDVYRFIVRDDWEELLAHEADGTVLRGSIDALEAAQVAGRELKVAIRGLASDLGASVGLPPVHHEIVTDLGSGFFHVGPRLYNALSHPIVRVAPAIPLRYRSRGWDLVWVHLRTDGRATVRRLDPWTRAWTDTPARFAARWFAR
jgi:hypothetical protein